MEKDGQKWAVEVELSIDNLMKNVVKDLGAYDRIIICGKNQKQQNLYEKKESQLSAMK